MSSSTIFSSKNSMLVMGECLMELIPNGDFAFHKTFAGDTYNSAVYAKRFNPDMDVSIFTAIGKDAVSESMLAQFKRDNINCSYVLKSDKALPGIYAISTDEHGERSFIYWRKESAATEMMTLFGLHKNQDAAAYKAIGVVYFSGISLCILSEPDKLALIDFVRELQIQGTTVAFDPNYRPKMWRNREHACEWMNKAYAVSDIAFPGLEDHEALFDHKDCGQVAEHLNELKVSEQVIKCGVDGTYVFNEESERSSPVYRPFTPAPQQIDSTAAGDSFSGTYLASRMAGRTTSQALDDASDVAALVVQHKGAIIPMEVYRRHMV